MNGLPLHKQQPIQSDDHENGLQHLSARVTAIESVSRWLTRLTFHLPGMRAEPTWERPNVAIRIALGVEFGDVSRVYTVRSASSATESIVIDVVVHPNPSPMMRWLARLGVGDTMEFTGPRPHFAFPGSGGRPIALFLDDTAIPALFALLSDPPTGLHGTGWVATEDETAFDELPVIAGLHLERIRPGDGFHTQQRSLADPADHVVWAAGERGEMKAVRSFFRREVGLAKDDVAVFGYWKRGTSNSDIDAERLRAYSELMASGGTLADLDDLALEI